MIKVVLQIDPKMAACCNIMQPMRNWLVPSMLAAGANQKIVLVKLFCKNELSNPNCSFIPPAFFLYILHQLSSSLTAQGLLQSNNF